MEQRFIHDHNNINCYRSLHSPYKQGSVVFGHNFTIKKITMKLYCEK